MFTSLLMVLTLVACDSESPTLPGGEEGIISAVPSFSGGPPPALDDVRPGEGSLAVGETLQLYAYDTRGQLLGASWSSSDQRVATVSSSGLVTGVGEGTATIRVKSRNVTAYATVIVTASVANPAPGSAPARVDVEPAEATLARGSTLRFSAVVRDAEGQALSGQQVTWSSSSPAVATVDAEGTVAGVAAGSAVISAAVDGVTGRATVTVTDGSTAPPAARSGFHVSPSGRSGAAGTAEDPWDLRTALQHPAAVRPGDTIWVRGGTYAGSFRSTVTGTSAAPIVIRAVPGERATIDGNLVSYGSWVVYWGLEIQQSAPRSAAVHGVQAYRPHNFFVNLVIHDTGRTGIGIWAGAEGSVVYGNIVYNAGVRERYDHGIYAETESRIEDNVVFNNLAYGIHVYAERGYPDIRNVQVIGNTAFNTGAISSEPRKSNLLLGGDVQTLGGVVTDNLLYFSGVEGTNLRLGPYVQDRDVRVVNNYAAGGRTALDIGAWQQAEVRGNTLIGTVDLVRFGGSAAGHTWSGNRYYRDPSARAWRVGSTAYDLPSWERQLGLTESGTVPAQAPQQTRAFVRPNRYEAGRANVTVFNWGGQSSVAVDLSTVLRAGDGYEVRNVQDFYGAPVAQGTYGGGSVSIPLGGVPAPRPHDGALAAAPRTGPHFDVFVVIRR